MQRYARVSWLLGSGCVLGLLAISVHTTRNGTTGRTAPLAVVVRTNSAASAAQADTSASVSVSPPEQVEVAAAPVATDRTPAAGEERRKSKRARTEKFIEAAMAAAEAHPVEVVRALCRLQPSPKRDLALAHAVAQWADVSSTDALDWVTELPPGDLKENLSAAAATVVATRDPAAAADFVASEMPASAARNRAVVAVIQRWAEVDPAAARAWTRQIPEPSAQEDGFREIGVLENFATENR